MRILILHKALVIGGVEKVLIDYLNIFSKLGYEVDLHLSYDLGKQNQHIKDIPETINLSFSMNRIDYLSIEDTRKNRKKSLFHKIYYEFNKILHKRKYITSITKKLLKNHYDIIIDFSYCSDYLVKKNIFRKYSSAKVIRWNHSQISPKDSKKMSRIYSYYDQIIAVSSEMAEKLVSELNLPQDKIAFIYNPINLEYIKDKSNQEILENLGRDYLLYVARLVDGKGLFELIEIYKKLRENGVRNKLYIIGDGELKNALKEKITEYSLEKDCILLGSKSNPYPYFKKAKAFLFTSEKEGLPTVLLESMALGTPVIAMNCPTGPREIIGNDEYGKLIDLHDISSFVKATISLLDNNELYDFYSRSSINRANDFDIIQCTNNIESLLGMNVRGKCDDKR